jgi:NitT/TauT family transport system substrate-binding protein/sulfonate transport system substrate-binding protein
MPTMTVLQFAARASRVARMWPLAIALVMVASQLTPAPAQDLPTLRVGSTFPGEEPKWLIVKRPELFKNVNHSYKIQWSVFQGTPLISQALVANAVDCGTQAPISMANAIAGGLQGYILGALVDEQPGYFSVFWAVRGDSGIKSAADLKGKTVASTAFGGGIYYHMRLWLKQRGVDPDKDIKLVEIPFPLVEEALRSGRVDAGPFAQPWGTAALSKGGIAKLFSISEVQSPLVNVFEVCRKDFTDKNTAVIKAYMEDYKDAMAYALSHPDETRQVVSEVTKLPFNVLQGFLLTKDDFYRPPTGRPNFAAIQKTWDIYLAEGVIKSPLKVTDFQRLDVTPSE